MEGVVRKEENVNNERNAKFYNLFRLFILRECFKTKVTKISLDHFV